MLCQNLGYEVVVFSDRHVGDSFTIADKLDKDQNVMYKLYKGHQHYVDGDWRKDLSLLNRDLKKVIIIDDTPARYSLQPFNGIKVSVALERRLAVFDMALDLR